MTTKNFFIYQFLLNASFGIGLLLMPQMMVDMYGTDKTPVTGSFEVVARAYGSLLTVFGIFGWTMRPSEPSLIRYNFFLITLLAGVLALIIHIRAMLQGVENSMVWVIILSVGLLTVWSGLLLSKEKTQISG